MSGAAKTKVATNKATAPVVPPAQPDPQGDGGDWGATANQAAAPAVADETKAEGQSQEQPNTAATAPVVPPAQPDPQGDGGETKSEAEVVKDEYEASTPESFAESLKELSRVQGLQEKTTAQAKRKAAALEKIQRHVHEIQQGVAAPNLAASDRKQSDATTRHAESVQWETLCRQIPLVKRFSDDYDALVVEVNKLRKQISEK